VAGVIPYLKQEGLIAEPLDPALQQRVEAVVIALGDRLKVFSDILKLGRYFFTNTVSYDPDAVKKRLRKEDVPAILAEMAERLAAVQPFDPKALEAAVHEYAEARGLNMGLVVNALRVATTGQGVGPGLYDCLAILGREACLARIGSAQELLGEDPKSEVRNPK
jgi:glutamyl-tRNA synthetase